MDVRTTERELDEMIARIRSATERQRRLIGALPACSLRSRKERLIRKMRDQIQRLESLRGSVSRSRRSGTTFH
jgi:hypothetical protein